VGRRARALLALGMAEHRSSHYAAALEALIAAAKAGPHNPHGDGPLLPKVAGCPASWDAAEQTGTP
jgi:hypothetical protein